MADLIEDACGGSSPPPNNRQFRQKYVGAGKGGNYGLFGTKFGAKRPNSSFLQGEQRQESGKKFSKYLTKFLENPYFSPKAEPKWGLGPIWSEDGSGVAKKGARGHYNQPISDVICGV